MTYSPRMHVVLYQPDIPQNTGNVGRTCVAVEAKLWLVRPLGFRLDDHHLRRAGLDYWQHLNWEVADNWDSLAAALPAESTWFFTKKAEREYTDASFKAGDALVFGSESQGLPDSLLDQNEPRTLRIPMSAHIRSLNQASAVAAAAYEARRQIGEDRG